MAFFPILFFFSLLPFTSSEPLPGFLSLSCGGSTPFTDSFNLSWVPDSPYINLGRAVPSLPLRFFAEPYSARNCYRLAVGNLSLALIRTSFTYNNYDGKRSPPAFAVSLGSAMSAVVNLSHSDPWVEEFVWNVVGETLAFCLIPIPGAGFPVISSLEVRPLPAGAYGAGSEELRDSLLRKRYRINCGYQDKGPLR
ncbi:putative LRR receptor-like serine/threonine-protein kinase [Dendrobium catenatum]|nr:putative LRR receptor-like serine/threonine-protein kinase [Dendrobium catenatum]